ncbi:hypothetical protein [Macrococcoides bohemicum]|uniref:PglD-related sugar-binding protein n=1 Tax=Macrococcoides bohemicum TaxID=1903056 RepID=UPI00165D6848|nr:hypothetical protein [Macrococcus bohemicus]MBC9875431.1 hypothetical protein [Macrococcus bohemicus]
MEVILIGRGGFSYVVEEELIAQGHKIVGYMDASIEKSRIDNGVFYLSMYDLPILGGDVYYFICIGNNEIRHEIYKNLGLPKEKYINIISKKSTVSPSAIMGCGNYVGINSVVNAKVKMGDFCIINTNATVEHDCIIGDFCLINTSSTLYSNFILEDFSTVEVGSAKVNFQPH